MPIFFYHLCKVSFVSKDYNRIDKLARAARAFLTSVAVDGSYIGIVDFDSIGVKQSGLTLINSDDTRDSLANLVPTEADGGTCIGCDLETALEVKPLEFIRALNQGV